MKLTFNQIQEVMTGAVRIEEEGGSIKAFRFTKKQEAWYKSTNADFYNKAHAPAGIKLCFKTNSRSLFLKITTDYSSSRYYFSVDVYVNGKALDYLDNYSGVNLPKNYTREDFPMGTYEKTFALGEGIKTVCVHLPWSVKAAIEEVSLDDGAFMETARPQRKLMAYGDSITQGYDALRPSNRYIAKVCEKFGYEEYNKAIGGEFFSPQLGVFSDDFVPDCIFVAYGTNDWFLLESREKYVANCRGFFENVVKNYSETQIIAITPIWRADMDEDKPSGRFRDVEENIIKATEGLTNVTVISGFDLVPQNESYYGDQHLHPNDAGFGIYAENLYEKLRKII